MAYVMYDQAKALNLALVKGDWIETVCTLDCNLMKMMMCVAQGPRASSHTH